MNQNAINIFDLLLGPVSNENNVSSLLSGGNSEEQSLMFGNVLNELLNPQLQEGTSESPINILQSLNTGNLPEDYSKLLAQTLADAKLANANSGLTNNIERLIPSEKISDNLILSQELSPPVSVLNDVSGAESNEFPINNDEQIIKENINISNILNDALPISQVIHNSQLQELLTSKNIDLEIGTYKVLDFKVDESNIKLTIINNEFDAEPIKVSLPIEILGDKTDSTKSLQSTRVALGFENEQPVKIENLLNEFKIKELEIKNIQTPSNLSSANSSLKSVEVALTIEKNGAAEIIKSKLFKDSIKASQKVKPFKMNYINTKNSDEKSLDNGSQLISGINRRELPISKQSNRNYAGSTPFDVSTSEELSGNYQTAGGKAEIKNFISAQRLNISNKSIGDILGVKQSSLVDNSHLTEMKNSPVNIWEFDELSSKDFKTNETFKSLPVKFTLPDNINTTLKPNGTSVRIDIHPENLGPARIKLILNNHVLRAEVLVDSAQAKTIVESSLNDLIEQLSKADIKVELIDVNINNQSNNHFANRNPQWKSMTSEQKYERLMENENMQSVSNLESEINSQVTYVNASGVNMLA